MITAFVTFRLPRALTRAQAAEVFRGSAPNYRGTPGLIRKYYLLNESGDVAGGCYLWESRAAAEAMYTDDWRATVRERYGAEPDVTWYETPVVVDNERGGISTDS